MKDAERLLIPLGNGERRGGASGFNVVLGEGPHETDDRGLTVLHGDDLRVRRSPVSPGAEPDPRRRATIEDEVTK